MKTLFITLRLFVVMTVFTGIIYPLVVTAVSQTLWTSKANGSLMKKGDDVIGSALIAQKFTDEKYFWPRPSATDYNAAASSGSNKGPTNTDLKKMYGVGVEQGFPQEMIFASASGLDPHISPKAALFQIDRIAKARGFDFQQKKELSALLQSLVEDRDLGFLGEKRVNVLKINLEMDKRFP